jgi:hypothetical protein
VARYRYDGPGPLEVSGVDGSGTRLIRPGDVEEFDDYPSWGPWEPLDEAEPAGEAPKADQPPSPPETSPAPQQPAPRLHLSTAAVTATPEGN